MQSTGSISRGRTAEKHNTRECYPDRERTPTNIDRERSAQNQTLVNRLLADVYAERFGAAAEAYSAAQVAKGHPERQIPDYLAKVQADKKLQPMYEFVVQLGNVDDRPPADVAAAVYRDWLGEFQRRWGGQFAVKQAIIHMDEATPHMHLEVVPVAQSKRGLSVQNSMNKAVKQAGFVDYKQMLEGWDECLTEAMVAHGIERVAGDRERQMGGVDIDTYRRSMEVKEQTAQEQQRLECLRQEVKELESAPQTLAESARALAAGRGDGSREDTLGSDLEGLRSQISDLSSQIEDVDRQADEVERGLPELRARRASLGERFDMAWAAVVKALEGLREVPNIVSVRAQELARKMGKPLFNPNSIDYQMRQATRAAEAWNRNHHEVPVRSRDQAR